MSLYGLGILLASLVNRKARKFLWGRRKVFSQLKKFLNEGDKIIWFHAASLGEFEQGRPVIEALRQKHPDYKILLTFFSPSGYEIRKDYKAADFICYLPLDFSWNANRFINMVKPKAVFFIKYEFWFNYTRVLHQKDIPFYCFSANFRPGQLFFKWYGFWYRNILRKFNHIYVQNQRSEKLLNSISIHAVTITGDTRFDRVHQIAAQTRSLPILESFKNNTPVVIAGSTWPADEEHLVRYINHCDHSYKFVIAPHEIHAAAIENLVQEIQCKVVKYSEAGSQDPSQFDVLIIDNIGMLSSVYQYGNIAYIGGGFGKGIHNILEAATFGLPVIFGPKYKKFQEAVDLVEVGGAFSFHTYEMLQSQIDKLITNPSDLKTASEVCKQYVADNTGSTELILSSINY
jgi:3-deoxy-D-manno-octulosonic-acid transferase